jgi:cation:H+ antiporter
MTILGIVGLAFGGQWVVDGAIAIATNFGLSETLIGLTIVAIGTSLPELATSAVAAFKHKTDIAIGNVVGSNLFNIYWVLGLSAVIKPMPFNQIINADIMVFLIAALMLFGSAFTGKKNHIDKMEGIVFLLAYIGYIAFLIMRG